VAGFLGEFWGVLTPKHPRNLMNYIFILTIDAELRTPEDDGALRDPHPLLVS